MTRIKQEKFVFILVILCIREYLYVFLQNKNFWVPGYLKILNFGIWFPNNWKRKSSMSSVLRSCSSINVFKKTLKTFNIWLIVQNILL